jgi:hypothetical protein
MAMKKLLIALISLVVVGVLGVVGWFYFPNRIALSFMQAHPGLLRTSFRQTEDGQLIERVLALYKDKPDVLGLVKRSEGVALDTAVMGASFAESVHSSDGLSVVWCEKENVPDCIRFGDLLITYAAIYDPEPIQSMYDGINRNFTIDDLIDSLSKLRDEADAEDRLVMTLLARQFELVQDGLLTIEEEHIVMEWVKTHTELQEILTQDLLSFNPYTIDNREAQNAVFTDADAYRAALALRDAYPTLTTFLYP